MRFLRDGEVLGVWGLSCHRHIHRHGENGLDKRLCRYHDGDDASDGEMQRFSKCRGCAFTSPWLFQGGRVIPFILEAAVTANSGNHDNRTGSRQVENLAVDYSTHRNQGNPQRAADIQGYRSY
jgi:hypothetical protein